jgi:hypothetical protein
MHIVMDKFCTEIAENERSKLARPSKSGIVGVYKAPDPDRVYRIVRNSIPEDSRVFHKGMLGYLDRAYADHLGVCLEPAMVWHTIMCEISTHISKHVEQYRSLFTTTPDKQTITYLGDAEWDIDPREFIYELRKRIPMGTDSFLLKFSSPPPMYDVALAAVFCEAMSPYYNYMMLSCGIPFVDVQGTVEDWQKIIRAMTDLESKLTKAEPYFKTITPHIEKIIASIQGEEDVAFWKDIYFSQKCGSGSQQEVRGWFSDFFMETPGTPFLTNYPTHISKFTVTQAETGKEFTFFSGVMDSKIVESCLIPKFNYFYEGY